jgi:hypothetical protein
VVEFLQTLPTVDVVLRVAEVLGSGSGAVPVVGIEVGHLRRVRAVAGRDEHPPVDGVPHPPVRGVAEPDLAGSSGALITGASPVSTSRDSAVGDRARCSPISAISAAATTGPIPVNDKKIAACGCYWSSFSDSAVEAAQLIGVHPRLLGNRVAAADFALVVPSLALNRCGLIRSTSTFAWARPL